MKKSLKILSIIIIVLMLLGFWSISSKNYKIDSNILIQNNIQDSTKDKGNNMEEKINKTEAEWKEVLTSEQYYVLRQKGTERAFTGKYDKHFEKG
ncbi:MAG TPA: peptide-methionine (R)-S-oxide reductase, partial [Ignavibacteriaceae bacterium]|nr:peptide-methionine (R)-S-oxide reductase [Ignavibacteriaceae bacterium]